MEITFDLALGLLCRSTTPCRHYHSQRSTQSAGVVLQQSWTPVRSTDGHALRRLHHALRVRLYHALGMLVPSAMSTFVPRSEYICTTGFRRPLCLACLLPI
eukprot:3349200-Rhodomonas_salina.1